MHQRQCIKTQASLSSRHSSLGTYCPKRYQHSVLNPSAVLKAAGYMAMCVDWYRTGVGACNQLRVCSTVWPLKMQIHYFTAIFLAAFEKHKLNSIQRYYHIAHAWPHIEFNCTVTEFFVCVYTLIGSSLAYFILQFKKKNNNNNIWYHLLTNLVIILYVLRLLFF